MTDAVVVPAAQDGKIQQSGISLPRTHRHNIKTATANVFTWYDPEILLRCVMKPLPQLLLHLAEHGRHFFIAFHATRT